MDTVLEILEKILSLLHIDVIGKKIEHKHNMIRERWTGTNYKPESDNECFDYLAKYYKYHSAAWAGASVNMPPEIAHGEVRRILDQSQGGVVMNLKNATRGRHGGTITLLDMIAEDFKKQATEKYVRYILDKHVDPTNYNLKVALMRQYLDQFARYMLPGEYKMGPHELAANFDSVIKMHVEMVNRYRNVVQ